MAWDWADDMAYAWLDSLPLEPLRPVLRESVAEALRRAHAKGAAEEREAIAALADAAALAEYGDGFGNTDAHVQESIRASMRVLAEDIRARGGQAGG